jgi:hypothetical protein
MHQLDSSAASTKRKILRKSSCVKEAEMRGMQWMVDDWQDGLQMKQTEQMWQEKMDSWLGGKRLVDITEIKKVREKLPTELVVTRIDRLPTEGLIM